MPLLVYSCMSFLEVLLFSVCVQLFQLPPGNFAALVFGTAGPKILVRGDDRLGQPDPRLSDKSIFEHEGARPLQQQGAVQLTDAAAASAAARVQCWESTDAKGSVQ